MKAKECKKYVTALELESFLKQEPVTRSTIVNQIGSSGTKEITTESIQRLEKAGIIKVLQDHIERFFKDTRAAIKNSNKSTQESSSTIATADNTSNATSSSAAPQSENYDMETFATVLDVIQQIGSITPEFVYRCCVSTTNNRSTIISDNNNNNSNTTTLRMKQGAYLQEILQLLQVFLETQQNNVSTFNDIIESLTLVQLNIASIFKILSQNYFKEKDSSSVLVQEFFDRKNTVIVLYKTLLWIQEQKQQLALKFDNTLMLIVQACVVNFNIARKCCRDSLVAQYVLPKLLLSQESSYVDLVVILHTVVVTHGRSCYQYISISDSVIPAVINTLAHERTNQMLQNHLLYEILSVISNHSEFLSYAKKNDGMVLLLLWKNFRYNAQFDDNDDDDTTIKTFTAMLKFFSTIVKTNTTATDDDTTFLKSDVTDIFDCIRRLKDLVSFNVISLVSDVVCPLLSSNHNAISLQDLEMVTELCLSHVSTTAGEKAENTTEEDNLSPIFNLIKQCLALNTSIMARLVSPALVPIICKHVDGAIEAMTTTEVPIRLQCTLLLREQVALNPVHGNFILTTTSSSSLCNNDNDDDTSSKSTLLSIYPTLLSKVVELTELSSLSSVEEKESNEVLLQWIAEMFNLLLELVKIPSNVTLKQIVFFRPPIVYLCISSACKMNNIHKDTMTAKGKMRRHVLNDKVSSHHREEASQYLAQIQSFLFEISFELCQKHQSCEYNMLETGNSKMLFLPTLFASTTTLSDSPKMSLALYSLLNKLKPPTTTTDDVFDLVCQSVLTNLEKLVMIYTFGGDQDYYNFPAFKLYKFNDLASMVMSAKLIPPSKLTRLKLWLKSYQLKLKQDNDSTTNNDIINGGVHLKNILAVFKQALLQQQKDDGTQHEIKNSAYLGKLLLACAPLCSKDPTFMFALTNVCLLLSKFKNKVVTAENRLGFYNNVLHVVLNEYYYYCHNNIETYGDDDTVTKLIFMVSCGILSTLDTIADRAELDTDTVTSLLELLDNERIALDEDTKVLLMTVINSINDSCDSNRNAQRQQVPLYISQLATQDSKITSELLYVLQESSVIKYNELHSKWQSMLAKRPRYKAGLISLSTLNALENNVEANTHPMVEWVNKEYEDLLK